MLAIVANQKKNVTPWEDSVQCKTAALCSQTWERQYLNNGGQRLIACFFEYHDLIGPLDNSLYILTNDTSVRTNNCVRIEDLTSKIFEAVGSTTQFRKKFVM